MNSQPSAGLVLKKMVLFTVLGFATIVLFGPVLAIVSVIASFALTLLPFVLVGFLVWTAFQLAMHGREETAARLRQLGAGIAQAFPRLGERLMSAIRFPFRTLGRMVAAVGHLIQSAFHLLWAFVRWLGPIAGMTLTGVAVGAGIGAAVGAQTHDPGAAVAINAALGGLMAASAGIVLSIAERKQSMRATSTVA